MELEEGDVVLCTVDRIVGTVVFVKIEGDGEGSIILSEIAPGRIRNIRNYVVPKKKIVCKILRISNGGISLSLRRVTQKEKKEVLEFHKQERNYKSILKTILKEKTEKIINEIIKKEKLCDFLQKTKENSKELENLVGKSNANRILKIINSQKKKKATIKKEIFLTTTKPNGIEIIKEILNTKEGGIKYISAGKYLIKTEGKDIKNADKNMKELLKNIEKKAKQSNAEFKIR